MKNEIAHLYLITSSPPPNSAPFHAAIFQNLVFPNTRDHEIVLRLLRSPHSLPRSKWLCRISLASSQLSCSDMNGGRPEKSTADVGWHPPDLFAPLEWLWKWISIVGCVPESGDSFERRWNCIPAKLMGTGYLRKKEKTQRKQVQRKHD